MPEAMTIPPKVTPGVDPEKKRREVIAKLIAAGEGPDKYVEMQREVEGWDETQAKAFTRDFKQTLLSSQLPLLLENYREQAALVAKGPSSPIAPEPGRRKELSSKKYHSEKYQKTVRGLSDLQQNINQLVLSSKEAVEQSPEGSPLRGLHRQAQRQQHMPFLQEVVRRATLSGRSREEITQELRDSMEMLPPEAAEVIDDRTIGTLASMGAQAFTDRDRELYGMAEEYARGKKVDPHEILSMKPPERRKFLEYMIDQAKATDRGEGLDYTAAGAGEQLVRARQDIIEGLEGFIANYFVDARAQDQNRMAEVREQIYAGGALKLHHAGSDSKKVTQLKNMYWKLDKDTEVNYIEVAAEMQADLRNLRETADPIAGRNWVESSFFSATRMAPNLLAMAALGHVNPALGVAWFVPQETTSLIREMRKAGVKNENLLKGSALIAGIVISAIEYMPGAGQGVPLFKGLTGSVRKGAGKAFMSGVMQWLKVYGGELTEETLQSLGNAGTRTLIQFLDKNAKNTNWKDEIARFKTDMIEAAGSMLWLTGPSHAVGGARGVAATMKSESRQAAVISQLTKGGASAAEAKVLAAWMQTKGQAAAQEQAWSEGDLPSDLKASAARTPASARTRADLTRVDLSTPEGVAEWVKVNPEKAKTLVKEKTASRKAFERAGLPKMKEEGARDRFMEAVRAADIPQPAAAPDSAQTQPESGVEAKKQAVREEFDAQVALSLDLVAGVNQAFRAGDLGGAKQFNQALLALHREAGSRFSGLDLSQLAPPIDSAALEVMKPPPAAEAAEKATPVPEPGIDGYTTKQLNAKSRTFLAGLAKARGVQNPGSMNRKALIRALRKTELAAPPAVIPEVKAPEVKPAPVVEPVKRAVFPTELDLEIKGARDDAYRAQIVRLRKQGMSKRAAETEAETALRERMSVRKPDAVSGYIDATAARKGMREKFVAAASLYVEAGGAESNTRLMRTGGDEFDAVVTTPGGAYYLAMDIHNLGQLNTISKGEPGGDKKIRQLMEIIKAELTDVKDIDAAVLAARKRIWEMAKKEGWTELEHAKPSKYPKANPLTLRGIGVTIGVTGIPAGATPAEVVDRGIAARLDAKLEGVYSGFEEGLGEAGAGEAVRPAVGKNKAGAGEVEGTPVGEDQGAPVPGPGAEAEGAVRLDPARIETEGKSSTVRFQGLPVLEARYVVTEADQLIPSHVPGGKKFSKRTEYPIANPRDYSDSNLAAKVHEHALAKQADWFLTESPDSANGAPVISHEGVVISGNGRAMSLQLAAKQKGGFGWYKDALLERAGALGLEAGVIRGMTNPVLSRMVDPMSLGDMERYAAAGNVATTYEMGSLRENAQLADLIDDEILEEIRLGMSRDKNQTVGQILAGPAGAKFRKALHARLAGDFPQKLARFFKGDADTLSESGKIQVQNLLFTKVFPVAVIEQMSPAWQGKLEGAIPQLLQLRREFPALDITHQIVEAVEFRRKWKQSGETLTDFTSQDRMFGEKVEALSPGARMLFDFLEDAGKVQTRAKLESFIRELQMGTGLFAEQQTQTPAEIAAGALGVEAREGAEFGVKKAVGGGAGGNAMAAIGGDAFAEQRGETAPKMSEKVRKVAQSMTKNEMVDGILEIIAPAVRGEEAVAASKIVRMNQSQAAQRDEAVRHQLAKQAKLFRWMPKAEIVEFIDRMETGEKQPTPQLQEVADTLRTALDRARSLVQQHGKLLDYYEHYFPHLFKRPDRAKDVIRGILGSRKLKPSSFLQKRKYITLKEGLDAGLKLAHYNPVEMTLIRLHEMHRYVAGANIMQMFKSQGLAQFVPANLQKDYLPANYEYIDDPAFNVVTNPELSVKEAYDRLLADQLLGVATAMGVSHERLAKMGGRVWGMSGPGKKIVTRFAGPLSVLAHEIGHQIGDQYALYEYMKTGEHTKGKIVEKGKYEGKESKTDARKKRGNIAREFRALADLRHEGSEVTKSRQAYERKAEEKEAVILEAWLASPEKMGKVAPEITAAWRAFLSQHRELRPLLSLDRSVVLGTGSTTYKLPGILQLGKWALPKEAATVINSQLKPGLRAHRNAFIRGTYEGIRFLGNAMNQASLSLSAFHALNVASDAISSSIGLGLQKIFRGQVVGGVGELAGAFTAPVRDIITGNDLIKAMRTDLADIGDSRMRMMIGAIISAGGRASMDPMYYNHAAESLIQTVRDLMLGEVGEKATAGAKLPFQMFFGALEATAKPIMQWQVPRLKLGVFYRFANDIFAEANRKAWSDERIHTELSKAWDSVDNRMGQLVYDNLHWARWLKDAAMAAVRSVGWNLGSIREFGGAIADTAATPARLARGDDIITRRMGYAVGSTVSYAMQAAVLTYLLSGKWPWEDDDEQDSSMDRIKDYFFPKTGRQNKNGTAERLSLPHYSKDWVAWATRPAKTAKHKMHPLWGTMADIIENEDYYGTKIRNEDDPLVRQFADAASHVAGSFLPFSVRNYFRMRDAGESPVLAGVMAASGISSAPSYLTRTRAQKLMGQLLEGKMPQGSRTREQFDYSRKRKDAIRAIRSGKKVDLGGYTSDQLKSIRRAAKVTSFQASFNRLGFEDALNVFMVTNTRERKEAFELLLKKKANAKVPSSDALQAFYELRMAQGELDARMKADQRQAGKDLLRLSTGSRKGESEADHQRRVEEIKVKLRKNPEFESESQSVRALMRAAAKSSGFKRTRIFRGFKLTPYGKRVIRVERELGLRSVDTK